MTEQEMANIGQELVQLKDRLQRLTEVTTDLREEALRDNPDWEEVSREQEEVENKVVALTALVKKSAITLGSTFNDGRFRACVTYPKRLEVDVQRLLQLYPAAKQVSGLLSVEVDKSRFTKAVECGEIPQEVADQVSKSVSCGNPRVRLTIKDA